MLKKIKFFKDRPFLSEVLDLVLFCGIAFLCAWLLTSFVILNGHVPTRSMEKIIMQKDRIVANRLAYLFSEPQRGDIVVFYAPDQKAQNIKSYYVKRIIGLPGDTVVVRNKNVYVNGQLLKEPYLHVITEGETEEFHVPEGHYFMMGDNRNDSGDSRSWVHPFVPREDILGKVFLKYSLSPKNFHFKIVKSYNDYDIK
jgi:signal peptidase I